MSEPTLVEAAPSAAEAPSYEIPRSGTPEYAQWRIDGTLPEKPKAKPAEPPAADPSKETTSDDAGDSAPKEPQEKQGKRRPDIEARFKQYTDEIRQLKAELEEVRRPKPTQAESSTAKPAEQAQPQNYQDWRKTFKAAVWNQQYAAEHPEASFEEIEDARADYLSDVRDHFRNAELARQQTLQRAAEVRAKAAEKYQDFEQVAAPMADKVMSLLNNPKVDPLLKRTLLDPEGFHILYALGRDQELVDKFDKLAISDPDEAIFLWKTLKKDVNAAIAQPAKASERNDRGQFTAKETPAKRQPEDAPEPPIEIGNRGSGPTDESERAFQAIKRGDLNATRNWFKAENAKELRRRQGI